MLKKYSGPLSSLARTGTEAYTGAMAQDTRDPGGKDVGEGDPGPLLPRPSRARFPGWLLPLLGGVAGGFVAGWWGAAFGIVVGFLVWRTRA